MKIKKVSNGYVVQCKDFDGNKYKTVIEIDEEQRDFDPYAVRDLISVILNELGIFISNRKYERENISVEIKHGTHYDCTDKGCEICNG